MAKVKVRFKSDFGSAKKGDIEFMSPSDVLEDLEKKGMIEIIPGTLVTQSAVYDLDNRSFVIDGPIVPDMNHLRAVVEQFPSHASRVLQKLQAEIERYSKRPFDGARKSIWFEDIKIGVDLLNTDYEESVEKGPKFYVDKYLKHPRIFDLITETEMDKQIVAEIPTRKCIFLCACGRLVTNGQTASYNLLVNSSAGAGKDYVVSKVLGILPEEQYVKKTRISPTVFTYWHNSEFEPEWTWNGKVFYTEDISETVLNHEVFKVMTSTGSQATVVIKQRAVDIDIKGKPVVITTTATSVPSPELTRRFEFCNMDEGIDQTREIMKRHSQYARLGISPDYNPDFTEALRLLQRVKVKIPFAEMIHPYFPGMNIMMRTKYPRFLDYIKASCAFHQFQRQKDGDGFLVAEPLDYEIARQVMKKLSSNKYMIPLTINQQKIMKFFEGCPDFVGRAQLLLNELGNFMALKNFQLNLGILVHYGLLEKHVDVDSYGRDADQYRLAAMFKEDSGKIELPEFDVLVKRTSAQEMEVR